MKKILCIVLVLVFCLGISMACAETVEFEYYALTSGVKRIGAKAQKTIQSSGSTSDKPTLYLMTHITE